MDNRWTILVFISNILCFLTICKTIRGKLIYSYIPSMRLLTFGQSFSVNELLMNKHNNLLKVCNNRLKYPQIIKDNTLKL